VKRALRLLLFAPVAGVFALAVHVDFPLCPLASTFGIPCPGCGLTRATLALLRGDIHAALRFHPLVWLLAPLFVVAMVATFIELVRAPETQRAERRPWLSARATSLLAASALVLTLAVWLLRFAGQFGGPVPVTSLREWIAARH